MAKEELEKLEKLFLEKHARTSVFSIEDCRALDNMVREKRPDDFEPLSDKSLALLRGELDSIASQYQRESSFWYLSTPVKRKDHANDVIQKAEELLSCFDLDAESRPLDLNPGHTLPGGILEDPEYNENNLILSLTGLIKISKQKVAEEEQNIADSDEPDEKDSGSNGNTNKREILKLRHRKRWLIGRLAIVYQHFWGAGKIGNTVYDQGGGGPGIRFLTAAAKVICAENFSTNTISHLLKLAPSPEEIRDTGDQISFTLTSGT